MLGVVLLLALAAGGAIFSQLQSKLDHNVRRISGVFGKLDSRPPPGPAGTLNLLLVGSDSRATQPGGQSPIGQRSDTVIILHLPADRKSAWFFSIPRDSWVHIPGHGKAKINAAFALGGPSLLVATVEELTGLRLGHYAQIDFAGFRQMTDAIGGVDITLPKALYDPETHARFHAGVNHLNGNQALLFVRQRHGLPNGDLDRIKHQQLFIRALMTKASSLGVLANPVAMNKLVDAATKALSIDSGLSGSDLRGLAWSLHNLSNANMHFYTVPITGLGQAGGQSVVFLAPDKDQQLFKAINHDRVAEWAASASPSPKG